MSKEVLRSLLIAECAINNIGKWSGINDFTCICYNGKVSFTSTDKKICKHDSASNKYKDTYICSELNEINSEELTTYNDYIFCGKYSSNSIISYHNNIINRLDSTNIVDSYKTIQLNNEPGIIDIKLNLNKNYSLEGYEPRENGLYIKILNVTNINIYQFNEFITDIHYSNELICVNDEMTNINIINIISI